MRASKNVKRQESNVKGDNLQLRAQNRGLKEIHISGAEGIYGDSERAKIVEVFMKRALSHPRGKPDRIVITIEKLNRKPKMVRSLFVRTVYCRSPYEARRHIKRIVDTIGISRIAYKNALKVLNSDNAMRGASLICCESGKRVEPDRKRGIRASRLGIAKNADRKFSKELSEKGINTITVKEAVVLASKVASCRQVMAELCISDDPGYTTGYIASREYGYVRIPHMKEKGAANGGRVFFITEDADRESVIDFLKNTPVIINRAAGCGGACSIDEILNHHI
jgi:6-carboxyhexanoate--CoA ligase